MKKSLLTCALALLSSVACAPSKILLEQESLPEHTISQNVPSISTDDGSIRVTILPDGDNELVVCNAHSFNFVLSRSSKIKWDTRIIVAGDVVAIEQDNFDMALSVNVLVAPFDGTSKQFANDFAADLATKPGFVVRDVTEFPNDVYVIRSELGEIVKGVFSIRVKDGRMYSVTGVAPYNSIHYVSVISVVNSFSFIEKT